MLEIAGSLWSVPAPDQVDTALRLKKEGLRRLHWDMADGQFAAAGGFTADQGREITAHTGLTGEAHIMAVDPLREVDGWTDFCDVIFIHAEVDNWERAADRIASRGARPGLAIALETSLSVIPSGMPVLCMSITPGQAGSSFDTRVLRRVETLRAAEPDRLVSIDGGVKRDLADQIVDSGAQRIVVGTDLVTPGGDARWADVLSG